MDWFHCNSCFRAEGPGFCVSSCGHIFCGGACATPDKCRVCGAACRYLQLSGKLKPEEQVYFKDLGELCRGRLQHISKVSAFQRSHRERAVAFFKHRHCELEKQLEQLHKDRHREVSELRKQISEMKKLLSQSRISPLPLQANRPDRLTRPVAITSPVTPRPHGLADSHSNTDSLERYRANLSDNITSPSSSTSMSGRSTPYNLTFRTPTNSTGSAVVYRPGSLTPSLFQSGSVSWLHSPVSQQAGSRSQYSDTPTRYEGGLAL
ncbi:RING finger protein 212B-like isoform X2 [Lepisosteus oculatus]|uniref:RING finger protein 212B-like isoform X2 n=1 Tax=Lepisosteus oculatus TaxID=7918 RepID=UPI003717D16C